jgi:hypothetical protein
MALLGDTSGIEPASTVFFTAWIRTSDVVLGSDSFILYYLKYYNT